MTRFNNLETIVDYRETSIGWETASFTWAKQLLHIVSQNTKLLSQLADFVYHDNRVLL